MAIMTVGNAGAQLYHAGETLRYKVSYKAKLFPLTEMADVTVATVHDTLGSAAVYRLDARGRVMPAYRWFYDLDDRYTLWIDTVTLRTLRLESDLKEGDYTFRSRYDYDWDAMRVHTRWRKRQREERTHDMALTPESMDAISLFFNMRSARAEDFSAGETRHLYMVLEDTIRRLDYRYLGREVKRIPRRGKFRTLKFACTIGTSDGYSFTDGTEFTLWISDDRNKIPLYLLSPVRIGSICAYIAETKGLKYPLDSKIR